jgi:hypothetical protein
MDTLLAKVQVPLENCDAVVLAEWHDRTLFDDNDDSGWPDSSWPDCILSSERHRNVTWAQWSTMPCNVVADQRCSGRQLDAVFR